MQSGARQDALQGEVAARGGGAARHCTLLGRRVRERAELFYAHDEDIAAPVFNSATSIQPTQTKPLLAI